MSTIFIDLGMHCSSGWFFELSQMMRVGLAPVAAIALAAAQRAPGPRLALAKCGLFDEAKIGGERLDLFRAQMARRERHRRSRRGMITLSPLLEPSLDIEVGEPAEARDVADAFAIGAVTSVAGNDVGF